jgi:hypothetical protein
VVGGADLCHIILHAVAGGSGSPNEAARAVEKTDAAVSPPAPLPTGRRLIPIRDVGPALNRYSSPPSVVALILLVPQGVVEIENTLTEGAAARGDTHIGAGQTCLWPIVLMWARSATRSEQVRQRSKLGGCATLYLRYISGLRFFRFNRQRRLPLSSTHPLGIVFASNVICAPFAIALAGTRSARCFVAPKVERLQPAGTACQPVLHCVT